MGFDLNIERVKRANLEEVKKISQCSLKDLYEIGDILYPEPGEEYSEYAVFCLDGGVYTNIDVFKDFFKSINFKCNPTDDVFELSVEMFDNMLAWLENYLKVTVFELIDELDAYDIYKRFGLFKQMRNLKSVLEDDDVLIYACSW